MKGTSKDYVTVVAVENTSTEASIQSSPVIDKASPFVTVLSINATETCSTKNTLTMSETVMVHRALGERLGFGLKFQGGTKSNETIQRLFIQSCTANSPASRVKASWGVLKEGDEILEINEMDVRKLTRMQCVQSLKESGDSIKLLVRNGQGQVRHENSNEQIVNGKSEKRLVPPPVPPRKLNRKKSFETGVVSKENLPSLKKSCSLDLTPPVDPELYLNLFSDENERASLKGSESDADTASTLSTVIDRFSDRQSICSSMSVDSDYDLAKSSNLESLAKVLKPFQLLEKEFHLDKTLKNEYIPMQIKTPGYEVMEVKPAKQSKQDYENVSLTSVTTQRNMVYENVEVKTPPKPLPRQQAPKEGEPRKRAVVVPTPRTKPPVPPTKISPAVTEVSTVQTWLNTSSDMVHECPVAPPAEILKVSVINNSNGFSLTPNKSKKKDPSHLPQVINVVPKIPLKPPEVPRTSGLIVDYSKLENEVFADFKNHKMVQAEIVFNDELFEAADIFAGDNLFDSLEEGEKLGPPEIVSQPGPSEAYFNFGWSPVALSTIGEADEDMSSLEYQPNTG